MIPALRYGLLNVQPPDNPENIGEANGKPVDAPVDALVDTELPSDVKAVEVSGNLKPKSDVLNPCPSHDVAQKEPVVETPSNPATNDPAKTPENPPEGTPKPPIAVSNPVAEPAKQPEVPEARPDVQKPKLKGEAPEEHQLVVAIQKNEQRVCLHYSN